MKNIKYIIAIFCMISVAQFSFGQATENNGRTTDAAPGTATVAETQTVSQDVPNTGTYPVDFDQPGQVDQEATDDRYYPEDLEVMNEEIMASTQPAEVAAKINELNSTVDDLKRIIEEMRMENQIIRESLSSCCSDSKMGLSASDAYLVQNAPNPFNATAQIKYFVPGGLDDVSITISDIKGEVIKSIAIEEAGYGTLEVGAASLESGSFIYMLSVKGEVVDSKVMIVTK